MFFPCGFPPLPPEHREKLGSVISFVQLFTLYDWVLSLGHCCPAMDWLFKKVLTCCTINHPGGNWSWWGPEDGTSLKWSQLRQDLKVVIVNQAQQWKNKWGQRRPSGGERGVKQFFLSRDVPNIHQKFTQGTHGCLVKDFISLEEKTQKNNRISNFLGVGQSNFH